MGIMLRRGKKTNRFGRSRLGIGRGRLEIVLQSTLGREHDIVHTKQTYNEVVSCDVSR